MYSGVIYTRTRTPPMLSGPFGYDFEAETTNVLRNQRPPPRLVTNRRVSLQTTGLSTRPLVAPLSRLFERTTPPAESDATNTRENTNRVDLFSRPIFTYDSTVFNGSSFVFFTFPPGVCIYIYLSEIVYVLYVRISTCPRAVITVPQTRFSVFVSSHPATVVQSSKRTIREIFRTGPNDEVDVLINPPSYRRFTLGGDSCASLEISVL